MPLTLYLAVAFDDVQACMMQNSVPLRFVGNRAYVGLREREADAFERASRHAASSVTKDTYALLKVRFSDLGVAHYVTSFGDASQHFASILSKKTFTDGTDWKVWHFYGDLPLRSESHDGQVLLETEWLQVA